MLQTNCHQHSVKSNLVLATCSQCTNDLQQRYMSMPNETDSRPEISYYHIWLQPPASATSAASIAPTQPSPPATLCPCPELSLSHMRLSDTPWGIMHHIRSTDSQRRTSAFARCALLPNATNIAADLLMSVAQQSIPATSIGLYLDRPVYGTDCRQCFCMNACHECQ